MPSYYSKEMLDHENKEAMVAKQRLAVWCGTGTYNNLKHLGYEANLEDCIESYRRFINASND